jgi:hypothetical protein
MRTTFPSFTSTAQGEAPKMPPLSPNALITDLSAPTSGGALPGDVLCSGFTFSFAGTLTTFLLQMNSAIFLNLNRS